MIDTILDYHTLTNLGLEDVQPELLLGRYVDTGVEDDPSDGWYNLTNCIFSNLIYWPPLSSGS